MLESLRTTLLLFPMKTEMDQYVKHNLSRICYQILAPDTVDSPSGACLITSVLANSCSIPNMLGSGVHP
jgi:hypothetical protein